MAGHGGGAWKVAYADFVTAMMAFFLVMWITAQNKQVKESIAKYFKDPFGGTSPMPGGNAFRKSELDNDAPYVHGAPRTGPGTGRGAAAKTKTTRSKSRGKTAYPSKVAVQPGGDRPSVGTMLLFAEDGVELDDRSRKRLAELIPILAGKANRIEIRGHSTGRPPKPPFQDAWQLCFARCLATMKFLQEHGIQRERFRLSQAGPYEPQSVDAASHMLPHKSRIEVHMLSEYVETLKGDREQRAKIGETMRDDLAPHEELESDEAGASAEGRFQNAASESGREHRPEVVHETSESDPPSGLGAKR